MPELSSPRVSAHAVKTKIVATVGPASCTRDRLRDLVRAGVDCFRLNFAHGTHEWLDEVLGSIRAVSDELNRPIAVLGDLAGPKIRLEELPGGSMRCEFGQTIEFVHDPDPANPQRLTCTYDKLTDELSVGDRVLLADGIVSLRVVETFPNEHRVVCKVELPGTIRSRQGINLPGVALSVPSLTDKDRNDLAWAVSRGLDYVGLSFVRSAADVELLRQAIAAYKSPQEPRIVAKIEKMEAVSDLEQILHATDAVMVARGDLGVEVDLALVPSFQKRIIRLCNQYRIPVITATQMLESMHHSNRPTRAEASDVANAVLDGADAVMLSGETAVGEYPVEAVATMNRIAQEAERLLEPTDTAEHFSEPRSRALAVTEAVTVGAVSAAAKLSADLIVLCTRGGKTALAVSRQRGRIPILGLTDSPETARRMCLYWGVSPICTPIVNEPPQKLLRFVVQWGMKVGLLRSDSKIVLVTSTNWSAEGHDLMLVHAIP